MHARIYVSLQGPSFNPKDFHARADQIVRGQVRQRKHTGAPLANVPLEYWASSPTVLPPDQAGIALYDLLAKIAPLFSAIPERATLQVFAHVVLEFDPGEEPVGLNFAQKTISLLRDIGAELDIDAVPRIAPP
jgi:hypothetical protein